MRAFSRLANALLGAALALASAATFAQQAPTTPATAAPDSVGPRTLQNFSLSGTVTRPADQTAAEPPAKKPQPAAATSAPPSTPRPRTVTQTAAVHPRPAPQPPQTAEPAPTSSTTADASKLDPAPAAASPTTTPAAAPVFAPAPSSSGTLARAQGFGILPWLLAALALAAAGAFLLWRNRLQHAVPAGPGFDLFAPPDSAPPAEPKSAPPPPAPAPKADPAPRAGPPASSGVVSSLRPWLEIGFQPLRCILEDQLVRVEFEIELFNSGSSPARDVLVEATLINAGEGQDERIASFFAKAPGPGERLPAILPLKRLSLKNQVFVPRDQLHAYELAGRQLFVPLIAFNAFYRSSSGPAQTSASYLLGRDTNGEKLAPFRADLGPRIFRGLAARPLPAGVRR